MKLAGADGCHGGWICVWREADGRAIGSACRPTAEALLSQRPRPAVLAIDIPIGLPEQGARQCDVEARRRLGRGRASSVFPAPARPVLAARSLEEARARRLDLEGRSLSLQVYGILAKVREVDEALRREPSRQRWVREVHPELSFAAWAGHPMRHAKRRRAGREERRRLVDAHFGRAAFDSVRSRYPVEEVASDDILDAFAALWTAERIASGASQVLPEEPPLDARGLRMEIAF